MGALMIEKQGDRTIYQYMYVVFYKTQDYDHFPLGKISISIADGQTIPYRPAAWVPLQSMY